MGFSHNLNLIYFFFWHTQTFCSVSHEVNAKFKSKYKEEEKILIGFQSFNSMWASFFLFTFWFVLFLTPTNKCCCLTNFAFRLCFTSTSLMWFQWVNNQFFSKFDGIQISKFFFIHKQCTQCTTHIPYTWQEMEHNILNAGHFIVNVLAIWIRIHFLW